MNSETGVFNLKSASNLLVVFFLFVAVSITAEHQAGQFYDSTRLSLSALLREHAGANDDVREELLANMYVIPGGVVLSSVRLGKMIWSLALFPLDHQNIPEEHLVRASEQMSIRGLVHAPIMEEIVKESNENSLQKDFAHYLLARHAQYRIQELEGTSILQGKSWVGTLVWTSADELHYELSCWEKSEGFYEYLLLKGIYLVSLDRLSAGLLRLSVIAEEASEYRNVVRSRLWMAVAFSLQSDREMARYELEQLVSYSDFHLYKSLSSLEFQHLIALLESTSLQERAADFAALAVMIFPGEPYFESKLVEIVQQLQQEALP